MELFQIALIGGVLALDATSVGQFMVSRPLVAGFLAGWLTGDPAQGVLIGALLELYLLVSFPTGGSRFPEGSTATVVAVAAAAVLDAPGSVPLGVAAGLVWGYVGGFTVAAMRKVNGRLLPETEDVDPRRLAFVHVGAMTLDGLRGALVTGVGALVGRRAVAFLADAWPLDAADSHGLLVVGAAVSAGIFLRDLGGFRPMRVLFTAGLALGLVGARFF